MDGQSPRQAGQSPLGDGRGCAGHTVEDTLFRLLSG